MPDTQFYTKDAALKKAGDTKATLATSKLRFTKAPFVPNQFSKKADLVANEADFDGYTSGGYALTAWVGPDSNPAGGAVITSPAIHVAFTAGVGTPVTNQLSGWWVELTAGDVWVAGTLDPQANMMSDGDALIWIRQIVEGFNVAPPA